MTVIGDMDEDALIRMIAPRLPRTSSEILGPGDDAAVLRLDGDLVISTDMLVEGRHFRLDWSSAEDVGWRAAVQNLADIDAMGAVPIALQVAVAAPATTRVDWVMGLADGLREACEPLGVGVVGGDLSGAREISVGVTAIGETRGVVPVKRSGARPGEVIAVSGALGASAAGLALLIEGVDPTKVDGSAVALFRRPQPRIGAGVEAARAGATSMMDISDSLVRDASRIALASRVGFEIASAAVPIHPAAAAAAAAFDSGAERWALTGGEDHHMVATFPRADAVPAGWTVIGEVTDGEPGVRLDGMDALDLGWDHFSR